MGSSSNIPLAAEAVQAAPEVYNAVYSKLKDILSATFDLQGATDALNSLSAEAASNTMQTPAIVKAALGAFLSLFGTAAAKILDTITQAKEAGQPGLHHLVVAAMADALQLDLADDDVPVGQGAAGQRAVNVALGGKFLSQLEQFLGANGEITGDSAEQAVQAFFGFTMQLSGSVGLLGLLGELFSLGHVKQVSEIGEMLEQSLGLGRLSRQMMRAHIQELVQKPLTRKLAAKAQQTLLGPPELIKEFLAGRISEDQCDQWLAEHGYSDTFIAALKSQHSPPVSESDIELLTAIGSIDAQTAAGMLAAQGIPQSVAQWRLQVLTYKRTKTLKDSILHEIISQIRKGTEQSSALDAALSQFGIPADEQQLWKQMVQAPLLKPAKKLTFNEVLFLFEAGQVTDAYVQQWLVSEGYSPEDQQTLLLLFELKRVASDSKSAGGAAAKAANTHAEHIAFITDEITGLWGRAPSSAELDYWVGLLDLAERTKADVKNELKALPTTGPAIPPGSGS